MSNFRYIVSNFRYIMFNAFCSPSPGNVRIFYADGRTKQKKSRYRRAKSCRFCLFFFVVSYIPGAELDSGSISATTAVVGVILLGAEGMASRSYIRPSNLKNKHTLKNSSQRHSLALHIHYGILPLHFILDVDFAVDFAVWCFFTSLGLPREDMSKKDDDYSSIGHTRQRRFFRTARSYSKLPCSTVCITPLWSGFPSSITRQPKRVPIPNDASLQSSRRDFSEIFPMPTFFWHPHFQLWRYRA